MTFDAVVGTCFVDLDLAPPPNHGKRFAGFSRVRRLRSASTMTFEVSFGIDFSTFSKTWKRTSGAYSFTLSMVLGNEKPFNFGSKVHRFFMFFQNRSRGPFWARVAPRTALRRYAWN
jgi:hypothetical protein